MPGIFERQAVLEALAGDAAEAQLFEGDRRDEQDRGATRPDSP
jgi:hypothetical protein